MSVVLILKIKDVHDNEIKFAIRSIIPAMKQIIISSKFLSFFVIHKDINSAIISMYSKK